MTPKDGPVVNISERFQTLENELDDANFITSQVVDESLPQMPNKGATDNKSDPMGTSPKNNKSTPAPKPA